MKQLLARAARLALVAAAIYATGWTLRLRMNPDQSHDEFTNAPPFATILSNRVVLADGAVRLVESMARVRTKGTNVYLVSFQGKSSWLVTQCDPFKLVVLEPKEDDSRPKKGAKQATISLVERRIERKRGGPAGDAGRGKE